ncbi:EbsA family protein [Lacticaseibacillus saniviri]|uniref:EbsA family protein n=2 Tax=Lacticaseibacillus saniviri TaxID=931533 RepID=UPI0007054775|nr:EbsA family protein [Lacticaseibacillus saniviri]
MTKFYYQPAWVDLVSFWGLILTGIAGAIILQEETTGLSIPALIIAIVALIIGIFQSQRYRLVITTDTVVLNKAFSSNQLVIPFAAIDNFSVKGRTLFFETQNYGSFHVVSLLKRQQLIDALVAAGITRIH